MYACGSAAKYPNSITGHAQVAGEGAMDARVAGRLAGERMAYEYNAMMRFRRRDFRSEPPAPPPFATQTFPVIRSDACVTSDNASSLASVGIHALCVGNCDSERMSTHAFWWTNQSASRSSVSMFRPKRQKRRRNSKSEARPVYGNGVVYYMDRTGQLRGVMTWGLPFTESGKGKGDTLNQDLIDRMEAILATNGEVALEGTGERLLEVEHLAEESRYLAEVALQGDESSSALRASITARLAERPMPLYRYTAAKPPSISSVGMLKRKDQVDASEIISENLYVRDEGRFEQDESIRPQSLVYVYPMDVSPTMKDDESNNPFLLSPQERMELAALDNDRRARPPKEEPLWFRREEANRNKTKQESFAEGWQTALLYGLNSDGDDILEQAPVPPALRKAQERLASWLSPFRDGEDNDDDKSKESSGDEVEPTRKDTSREKQSSVDATDTDADEKSG